MKIHDDFFTNVVANGIIIIMAIAIIFGDNHDIGYAAIADIVLIGIWLVRAYIRHPEDFRFRCKK